MLMICLLHNECCLKTQQLQATDICYLAVALALSDPASPTKQQVSGGAAGSSEGTPGEESLSGPLLCFGVVGRI